MGYPTFSELVQSTILQIGQVTGSSVQTYTEPLVQLAVNRTFEFVWNKRKWDHLWTWDRYVLDGTTGKFTTAMTSVNRVEDIDQCRIADQEVTIPFPIATEHLSVTGSSPLYRTALPWDDADAETKFIKFWPILATGSVDVFVGHRPDKFVGDDDVVPMDEKLMVDGATWYMLADDGINPESAVKAQTLFDGTYKDLVARLGAKPIGHGRGLRNGRTVTIS